MSLDDTFRQMQRFHNELNRFNNKLLVSMQDLQAKHDQVSPLWQDEMRREYDSQWQDLDEVMKDYLRQTAPSYIQFMDGKLRDLSRYLRGR